MGIHDYEQESTSAYTEYGEVLLDKNILFHGVGYDFTRVKGVLENGILSEEAAMNQGLRLSRNYGGYNLSDAVSVTQSPSVNNTFTFGAFHVYISDGVSFVVSGMKGFKAARGSKRDSGYIDEVYVSGQIPLENIAGVMVPENELDTPISRLPIGLSKMGYGYIDNRCRAIVASLERDCDFKEDISLLESLIAEKQRLEQTNLGYLEKDAKRKEIFAQMEGFMQVYKSKAYAKLLNKETVTLHDLLRYYLPPKLRVFNNKGFQINI